MSTAVLNAIQPVPKSLTNLTLWIDAADRNTISLSGTGVTQVRDKSPIENNYGQATAGQRPTYQVDPVANQPGFLFTRGSGTNLTPVNIGLRSLNATSWTMFFVVRFTDANETNVQTVWRGQLVGAWNRFYLPGNASFYVINSDVQFGRTFATASGIWCSVVSTSSQTIYQNGTQAGTGGRSASSMSDYFTLGGHGGGEGMTGYLYEFVMYNSVALTDANRQLIEGYLAWKWGLQASLPQNHPYFSRNPGAPVYPIQYTLTPMKDINLFDPRQISNCVVWLDAADTTRSSMIINAAGTVTSWFSKANTNNLGSFGTILRKGTIGTTGLPTISVGNGSTSYFTNLLGFGGNTAQTYVMLVSIPSNAVSANINCIRYFNSSGGNAFSLSLGINVYNNQVQGFQNQGGAVVTLNTASRPQMAIVMQNGTTQFVFESGTQGSTVNYTLNQIDGRPRVWYTASGSVANGEIAEFLIYSKALTVPERQQIEGYLAWKWGLQANLITGHPYKNSPFGPGAPGLTFPLTITDTTWNPKQFPGFHTWIDASDRTNVFGTAFVTSLNNKNGSSEVFNSTGTGLTYTNINGLQSINFPSGTNLANTASTNLTTGTSFIVFRSTNANAQYFPIYAWRGPVNCANFGWLGENVIGPYVSFSGNQSPSFSVSVGSTYIVSYTWRSGSTTTLGINGGNYATGSIVSLTGTTTATLYIGWDVTASTRMNLGEILIYNSVLSVAQQRTVEGYLAWKWKLQGSLPSTHPYYLFPPPS